MDDLKLLQRLRRSQNIQLNQVVDRQLIQRLRSRQDVQRNRRRNAHLKQRLRGSQSGKLDRVVDRQLVQCLRSPHGRRIRNHQLVRHLSLVERLRRSQSIQLNQTVDRQLVQRLRRSQGTQSDRIVDRQLVQRLRRSHRKSGHLQRSRLVDSVLVQRLRRSQTARTNIPRQIRTVRVPRQTIDRARPRSRVVRRISSVHLADERAINPVPNLKPEQLRLHRPRNVLERIDRRRRRVDRRLVTGYRRPQLRPRRPLLGLIVEARLRSRDIVSGSHIHLVASADTSRRQSGGRGHERVSTTGPRSVKLNAVSVNLEEPRLSLPESPVAADHLDAGVRLLDDLRSNIQITGDSEARIRGEDLLIVIARRSSKRNIVTNQVNSLIRTGHRNRQLVQRLRRPKNIQLDRLPRIERRKI